MKEWILRTDKDATAYTAVATTLRSMSQTQSMMAKTGKLMRQLNTASAIKQPMNQASTASLKQGNMNIMEELDDSRKEFQNMRYNSSVENLQVEPTIHNRSIEIVSHNKNKNRNFKTDARNTPEMRREMNEDSDEELVRLGDGSPMTGKLRGGRGRSPMQPSQKAEKFATVIQPDRKRLPLMNRPSQAKEPTFFDDENKGNFNMKLQH